MMKRAMMKRAIVILLALCLALSLGAAAESAAGDKGTGEEAVEASPAGYVLITTASQYSLLPLPTEGEQVFPLSQTLDDGTELLNVLHLTPDGVYIEDANCENHDCVNQGEVTLENREERILGNMIICLPNQVMLQLFTPEEVRSVLEWMPDADEAEAGSEGE